MQLIKLHRKNNKISIFFSNHELKSILQLYSNNVANGIFKDYAIDHGTKNAIFSFYKHAYDKPLFQIEKVFKKKNDHDPEFLIKYKMRILEKNKSLNVLIKRLSKKFKILK